MKVFTLLPPAVEHKMHKETAKPFAFWRVNSFVLVPVVAPRIKDLVLINICADVERRNGV